MRRVKGVPSRIVKKLDPREYEIHSIGAPGAMNYVVLIYGGFGHD